MDIVLDNRPGHTATGIGRYTRSLQELLVTIPGARVLCIGGLADERPLLESSSRMEEEIELPRILARENISIYHTPLFMLPALLPCASVITIHDCIPGIRGDLTNPDFAHLWEEHAADAAARADAIVCPSEHAKRDIVRALDVPADKINVIPEAPAPCFRALSAESRAAGRARLPLPPRYLLVVGSLERRKNPLVVLDALAALGGSHTDLLVIYVGPPAGIDVAAEAARRGLAERVRVLGHVPDEVLVLLYNEAVALVFPSLYEGFGLPVVEAFACGTPVIASSAASIPEVAGDAALIVPPEDATALALAIRAICESPEVGAELRARGKARLRERFAAERVRAGFFELYSSLERRREPSRLHREAVST